MIERDVFDLLRAGDPAPVATLDGPDSELGRRILATVMAGAAEPEWLHRHRTRRRVVIAALIAIVIAAASAAGWYLATRPVTNPEGMSCHSGPSLESSAIVVPIVGEPTSDTCLPLWTQGSLPVDGPSSQGVPPLVSCVTDSGTFAVFPSDDDELCSSLGLGDVEPSSGPTPTSRLSVALIEQINPDTCRTLEEATAVVESELERLGLTNWQVTVRPDAARHPCASIEVDGSRETVTLTLIPREP